MKHPDNIRSVVARFFNVAESEVTESFAFPRQRLGGSVARSTLHAALKRLAGVDLPTAFTANTYGQLIGQIPETGSAKTPDALEVRPSPSAAPPVIGGQIDNQELGIGIDVEFTDNLPWTGDPWTDSFCVENFTSREIAYCIRQPNPKLSLCGLWSAKEAVIKCGHGAARLRPKEVEIGHDDVGKPLVQIAPERQEFMILDDYYASISHSNTVAVAVSVKKPRMSNNRDAKTEKTSPSPVFAGESNLPTISFSSLRRLVWFNLILSVLAIILFIYHFRGTF